MQCTGLLPSPASGAGSQPGADKRMASSARLQLTTRPLPCT